MNATARGIRSWARYIVAAAIAFCLMAGARAAPQPNEVGTPPPRSDPPVEPRAFDTPQQAADALLEAAATFDVPVLLEILGLGGEQIVLSGEPPLDRQRAAGLVAEARKKKSVIVDPEKGRAFLHVGNDAWPFAVPIVKKEEGWAFDSRVGRQEILRRRIGQNELDAIGICRGYVEAQHEYALRPREGDSTRQYARRVISTPGKRDGLAWRNPDGSWGGPVGEKIARAIEQGYTTRAQPYHGYFFKVLKGQGPAAPLGAMDFMVKGLMIGGFALAAAPAKHGVTGVKTFIVSHDGVVYEKDLGPKTLEAFAALERFDPDDSWTHVPSGTE